MSDPTSRPAPTEPAADDWGRLHVSRQCCGAGICRNVAPELLGEVAPSHSLRDDGGHRGGGPAPLPGTYEHGAFTGVLRQPRSKEEYLLARTAVATCPFGALRLERPAARLPAGELGSPWRDFPRRLEDNVWMVGHPSPRNFGALPYFIELPGGGVLVDVPQPSEELFRWLDEHGGVRWMFLTHRDHVQGHAELAARFPGCRRVLAAADVRMRGNSHNDSTGDVELKLDSTVGPMTLEGAPIPKEALADAELVLLPQPGHTAGTLCLLYRGKFLFTGDHLCYSRYLGSIASYRIQCWQEWSLQCESVGQLAEWADAGWLRFTWILPGHGALHRFDGEVTPATTAAELRRGLDWMRRQSAGRVSMLNYIPWAMSRINPRTGFARFVRAVGGAAKEAWLLPRAARPFLVDYDPAKTDAAIRRLYALAAAALVVVTSLGWLGVRAASWLLAR